MTHVLSGYTVPAAAAYPNRFNSLVWMQGIHRMDLIHGTNASKADIT